MIVKKPRGRPPNAATIERRRIEEILKNPPAYLLPITDDEKQQVEDSFKASEIIRKQILRDYKTSVIVPDDHAYRMASLGDESMEGYEGKIIKQDAKYRKLIKKNRNNGTKGTRAAAEKKVEELYEKNKSLIDKIKPNGPLTINGVARTIIMDWPRRGVVDDEAPSERTIRTRLNKIVGKGLGVKK
jgi:hypothetical protein